MGREPRTAAALVPGADLNRKLIEAVRSELAARADPQKAPRMQAYMKSELPFYGCQIGSKSHTDTELLLACIEPSLGDGFFFIRKAIGLALREYSRTDPEAVAGYVEARHDELSALSRREAVRRLVRCS